MSLQPVASVEPSTPYQYTPLGDEHKLKIFPPQSRSQAGLLHLAATISHQHNINHQISQQPMKTRAKITPRFQWGIFQAVSYCWKSDVKEKEAVLHG
jgi:hypothetical protein